MLETAKNITLPIQLLALIVIGIVIIGVFSLAQGIPPASAVILALAVVSLLVFAIIFTFKGAAISNAGQAYSDSHPASETIPPDELPTELTVPNEMYNHVAPALEALGFRSQQSVDSTRWGKTYRYSEAEKPDHRIILIQLDPSFFEFGTEWFQKRWLSFAVSVFRTPPNQLVILSETKVICQEAHYEVDDVRRRHNVDVVFLTKLILDTIRGSGLEDNKENLKLHLRLG